MTSKLIQLINSGYTVQIQKVHTTIIAMAYEVGCEEIISRPLYYTVDEAIDAVYQQIKERRPSLFKDFEHGETP